MPAAHDSAAKIVKNSCLQARTVYHNRSHFIHPLHRVGYARVLSLARLQQGLLFYFQSGRLLTRGVVSHLLRDIWRVVGLCYQSLEGHSFCIGAALVAAAAGLPDWLIKVMGRWSSDCYQLYIRTPISTIESVAARMANIVKRFSPN